MEPRQFYALAAATPPAEPTSPSTGYPSYGSEPTGVLATVPGPYWYHQIGAELRNVLTAASVMPSASNLTQLAEAIQLLIGTAIDAAYPVGVIEAFPFVSTMAGWAVCNGSAISRSANPVLFSRMVTDAGFTEQIFTVTIASPAVFTKTGYGLAQNARLRLYTTGELPSGLGTLDDYFVLPIDANTFNLATAPDGTPINTTGAQSGAHSYMQSWWGLGDGSTTFNVPDLRSEFIQFADLGRGIISGRLPGMSRPSSVGPHKHFLPTSTSPGSTPAVWTISDSAFAFELENTIPASGYPDAMTLNPTVDADTAPRSMGLVPYIRLG